MNPASTPGRADAPAGSRWRAADVHLADHIHTLDAAEVAELDAALALIRASGQSYLATTRTTTLLPTLEAKLARLHDEVRDGAGFVLLRGLPVHRWSKDDVRAVAWTIATRFGTPVSQNAKGARVADVMDVIKGSASPRGYHSNAELKLHTDPASDLMGLCVIEVAKEGGDSTLASAVAVHDVLRERHPELLQALYEGFAMHRFGEGREGEPDITDYKVPVFSNQGGTVSCRYGSNRIRGAAEARGESLSDVQRDALAAFRDVAASPELSVTFRMQPGDFLFCNNLTMLHARTTFVDNDDPERPRHLLRFWLEGHEGFRPIPPEMNFFNGGRCGIPPKAGA